MKRLLLMMAVALLGVVGSVQAQKVDEGALLNKIEKSKQATEDPVKGLKPATWITLGASYYDAAVNPTVGLFKGLDEMSVGILFGKVAVESAKVGGKEYSKMSYPYFDIYLLDGKVAFWKDKKEVVKDPLKKAVEAYNKAYSISSSSASKVKPGLQKVINAYKQKADNANSAQEYALSAGAFAAAYDIAKAAPINVIDTVSAYNAGILYTVAQEPAKAEPYLLECQKVGYEQGGDLYYYLYHAYFGQQQNEKAKQTLLDAIAKYPKNNKIVEALLSFYATTGGDSKEIIPFVMKAIQEDPKNPDLYSGLGRIYDKLNDLDKAVEAFQKAIDLTPDEYSVNFNMGFMMIKKGDAAATALREKPLTSQEEFNAGLAKVNAQYAMALAPLEKAHNANPQDIGTVELLKNLYFRLRDESPAMMDGYNKYNELFKSMQ